MKHLLILAGVLVSYLALLTACEPDASNGSEGGDETPTDTASPTPIDESITFEGNDITFNHKYGEDDCPTPVGELVVYNNTEEAASVSITIAGAGLKPVITDPANSTTVPAGGMTTIYILFDCGMWDSETLTFNGTIKLDVTAGDKSADTTITWNGQVSGYPGGR